MTRRGLCRSKGGMWDFRAEPGGADPMPLLPLHGIEQVWAGAGEARRPGPRAAAADGANADRWRGDRCSFKLWSGDA